MTISLKMFNINLNQEALVGEEDGGRAAALDVDDVDVLGVDLDILRVGNDNFEIRPYSTMLFYFKFFFIGNWYD